MVTALLASFLAEVLLLSATFKLLRYQDYLDGISSYTALRRIPGLRRYIRPLAWGVPTAESIAGAALLFPRSQLAASIVSCGLFLSFYMLVGADQRSLIANCGCWGRTSVEAPRIALAVRNAFLVAAAGFLVAWQLIGGPPPTIAISLAAIAIASPFSLLTLELPQFIQVASIRSP